MLSDGDCDDLDDSGFSNAPELCDGQYNDCTDVNYSFGTPPALESDDDGDTYVECDFDASSWVGNRARAERRSNEPTLGVQS